MAERIYTRSGDTGTTGTFGGKRLAKDHPICHAVGSADELNCVLGVALANIDPDHQSIAAVLRPIRHRLFDWSADLNTPDDSPLAVQIHRINQADIDLMEQQIDQWTRTMAPLHGFILPAGHPLACQLHLARTICRRAERWTVTVADRQPINPLLIGYLNRLSDLLFTAARYTNHLANITDPLWQKQQDA